ncbi:unnamed protein product [Gordionus sp. m RMFG-2023]
MESFFPYELKFLYTLNIAGVDFSGEDNNTWETRTFTAPDNPVKKLGFSGIPLINEIIVTIIKNQAEGQKNAENMAP